MRSGCSAASASASSASTITPSSAAVMVRVFVSWRNSISRSVRRPSVSSSAASSMLDGPRRRLMEVLKHVATKELVVEDQPATTTATTAATARRALRIAWRPYCDTPLEQFQVRRLDAPQLVVIDLNPVDAISGEHLRLWLDLLGDKHPRTGRRSGSVEEFEMARELSTPSILRAA